MKKGLFLGNVFLCSFILLFNFILDGCGVATLVTASGIASDRRQENVVVSDRFMQIKIKSDIDSALGSRGHIEVTVYNGTVLLTGQVKSIEDRLRARIIASRTKHIHKLISELSIAHSSSIVRRARDSALTTNIVLDLAKINDRFSSIIHVVAYDGIVYLMGIVTREEADISLSYVNKIAGVEKIVDFFEIVSPETAGLLDAHYLSSLKKEL